MAERPDTHPARLVVRVLWSVQRLVLHVSFAVHRLRRSQSRHVVVGLCEHAGYLTALAGVVPDAVTVKVNPTPYFHHDYSHDLSARSGLVRALLLPWLLGRLAPRAEAIVYVSDEGFLKHQVDGRDAEMAFLRDRGVRVVCVFTGTDIRSHELTETLGRTWGRDMVTTYQEISNPGIGSPAREAVRRRLAAAADARADVIVNPPVDQLSFLTRPTEPFPYLFPDERVARHPEKWQQPDQLRVLHAPSSPLIKGTPLVRAAVAALRAEGHELHYVELSGVSNAVVLEELARAHVVLNEFYALLPGVFGVEAMAANAVLLTSADETLEPSLPEGSNEAWRVTPPWGIEAALRRVLAAHGGELQAQADRGTEWVQRHASARAGRADVLGWLGRTDVADRR